MSRDSRIRRVILQLPMVTALLLAPEPHPLWAQVEIEVTTHPVRATWQGAFPDGNLVAFLAAEEPGRDFNGDGDVRDAVASLLDLTSGRVTNLGLAVSYTSSSGQLDLKGDLLAFHVWETVQGELDRNGDGDALDAVPVVYRVSTGELFTVGLEGRYPEIFGDRVFFSVRESHQGEDLNGDGDELDTVPHVLDARDGSVTNLGVSVLGGLIVRETGVLAHVLEDGRIDLNGDGDSTDAVLHVFDPATLSLQNIGFATRGEFIVGNQIVMVVDESAQGEDLNEDGDRYDRVLHVLDRNTDGLTNVGVSAEAIEVVADSQLVTFIVYEFSQGRDLNGDGDVLDRVVHVYDLGSGELINLGIVAAFELEVVGQFVAFRASEAGEAADLNGDGDADDLVVQVYDHVTGTVANLGLAATAFLSGDDRSLAFRVSEPQQQTDLNGDGDVDDEVLHFYDCRNDVLTNLNVVSTGGWAHEGGRLAYLVGELDNGNVDLNGDGDTWPDEVVHVFDGVTIHNLGVQGRYPVFDGDLLVFTTTEGWEGGRDLNSDGDTNDHVLATAVLATLDPVAIIEELIVDVQEIIEAGEINYGRGRSLIAELQVALWFLEFRNGERIAAIRIELFIIKVQRLIDSGDLEEALGTALLVKARSVLRMLQEASS